jgi:adenylosuccinate lyase
MGGSVPKSDIDVALVHPMARIASSNIQWIWLDTTRFRWERRLWLTVMAFQAYKDALPMGNKPMSAVLAAYRDATNAAINMKRIRSREIATKHDLKARLEEYNFVALSFYDEDLPSGERLELAHLGMTSADVVDNIALVQMRNSLRHLTTLTDEPGVYDALTKAIHELPFRGIKGPVGTQQDQVDILGSQEAADELDSHVARSFDFPDVMNSVGQVYPRSLDLRVASAVMVACFMHLEAGNQGDRPLNPQMLAIARGYYRMIGEYSGDQWNEGDVSTSVIRRVCLPGLFLAADCILRNVP